MSGQTRRRAAAYGVATSYRDWRGRHVEVSDKTLAAIVDALSEHTHSWPGPGDTAAGGTDGPGGLAGGPARLGAGREGPAPGRARRRWPWAGDQAARLSAAPRRAWGFTVQLYSLRSHRSWGHGDLADLAAFATWSATELGAGFTLINPLHAAEPLPPVSASPYLPMSRRFISPLYLRVEDIPEYAELPPDRRQRISDLAAPLRAANTSPALIDRDAVWRAKRAALEIIYDHPLVGARRAAFERYRVDGGGALSEWATWCALAEAHGPDWRTWPGRLQRVESAGVAKDAARLAPRARFHAWLQWLADGQRAAAQAAARAAGMSIGVIGDLAVGAHPGGADAWAQASLTVPGMSVGAPPDEFNQRGQDWAQRPWHPGRLVAAGCRPLAELARAGFAHSGGLRADHVMSLFRLWWVPDGMSPAEGTYVRYRHEATIQALTREAARAGALAIGEDLGTVEPWVRDYLTARGVLGTSMLWFERAADGSPLPPAAWRRSCLATVGTHDVPPAAAFATGEQVELRARLGLLTRPVAEERRAAAAALAGWRRALAEAGLIAAGADPDPAEFTTALYGYLARTPAALIGVSLADAVGDRRPQNIPGTVAEYPNWRIPLCDTDGNAVLLEDLAGRPDVTAAARAAASAPGTGRAR